MNLQRATEHAPLYDRAGGSLLRKGSAAAVQSSCTRTWASALRALRRWPLILVANAAIAPSLLTACATETAPAPPKAPASVQLQPLGAVAVPLPSTSLDGFVVATDALNPSITRRPLPLQLCVDEVRSDTAFVQADFKALPQSDRQLLGSELVARDEIALQPGAMQPLARTLSPQTRFIGVLAAYREVERSRWRALTAVQPSQANLFVIHADALPVSAAVKP